MIRVSAILNATDVRKNWGQFNDDVVREGPKFVKRNRDKWAALSSEHLKVAFSDYTFTIRYLREEDGTITASLDKFVLLRTVTPKKKFST